MKQETSKNNKVFSDNKHDYRLESLIEDTVSEFKEQVVHYTDFNDAMHEIADSNVPIYYHDLAKYLEHNFILGHENEHYDGEEKSAFKLIQINIYYELHDAIYQAIEKDKQLKKDCQERGY